MRNLEIIVKVTDRASKDLDKVAKSVDKTGAAAKNAEVDFTKFNKTLFTTAAFVGTFTKMASSLSRSLDQGSELDRLSNQFERALGPKGRFFDALSTMTDASIDKMEAMKQGISLRSLGIVGSVEQAADAFSKAGVAAKMAGMDSGEGIKAYSDFLKTGNVSNLQFLNLIHQANPALQAQMAIIGKVGGVMGTVISTQARLAMGQRLLNIVTAGSLKGFRDLRDTVLDFKQNFVFFRMELGRFLLTALQPLIDKFSLFLEKAGKTLDMMRKNEKNLLFLAKATVIATGAVLGLAGALGTLRLGVIALTSLGIGLPRLLLLLTGLGVSFLSITQSADKFIDKLKLFAGFVKGVYQLVTSLDTETGFSKIDKDIKDLLEKNGIFIFAQNIARGISVAKTAIMDLINAFTFLAKKVDDIFGRVGRSFINLIQRYFKDPWENWLVNDSATSMEKFKRNLIVWGSSLGAVFSGIMLKFAAKSLISKLPGFGGLAGGRGPKGTPSDPVYTASAGGVLGRVLGGKGMMDAGKGLMAGQFASMAAGMKLFMDLFRGPELAGQAAMYKNLRAMGIPAAQALKEAGLAAGQLTAAAQGPMGRLLGIFGKMLGPIGAITVGLTAFWGAIEGIVETSEEWGKFFHGIGSLVSALANVVTNFIFTNKVISTLANGIWDVGKFLIITIPSKLLSLIKEGWKNLFGWMGVGAGRIGEILESAAKEIDPSKYQKPEMPVGLPGSEQTATMPGGSGQKTNISIPDAGQSQEDVVDSLGEQLKLLDASQRKKAQSSIEQAMLATSGGGEQITPEEMSMIMKSAVTSGFDNSEVANSIDRSLKSKSSAPATGSRR